MYVNKLKEKIKNGEYCTGSIIQGALPALVEISGLAGFDFAFIDCEHGPMTQSDCENLIRAAESVGIVPLIRTRELNESLMLRYMDAGAMGIIVPGIRTKEEAEEAVRCVKYFPYGHRGLSATRSAQFGLGMPMKDYVEFANEQTIVACVIESAEAVDNIEEILGVDGMDFAIIGTSDLSHDLGHPGEGKHPNCVAYFEKAVKNGNKTGKPICGVVRGGETAQTYYKQGCRMAVKGAYGLFGGACKNFCKEAQEYKG